MSDDIFGQAIYSYTRADAIRDGVLIDVSEQAKDSGFTIPVALTAAVYQQYIVPPLSLEGGYGQSIEGRLHDTLFLLYVAIKRGGHKTDTLYFTVGYLMENGVKDVALKAVIDGGDDGKAVLTILLPEED